MAVVLKWHCQVEENFVVSPPRYCDRGWREPSALGIRLGVYPQLDNAVVSTSRENTIQSWMANGDRFPVVQAAEQTAHPTAVRAGGRVLPQTLV